MGVEIGKREIIKGDVLPPRILRLILRLFSRLRIERRKRDKKFLEEPKEVRRITTTACCRIMQIAQTFVLVFPFSRKTK